MSDQQRLPLYMLPNGALVRSEVPLEGVVVIEPELPDETDLPPVIDQTQAVHEAENIADSN